MQFFLIIDVPFMIVFAPAIWQKEHRAKAGANGWRIVARCSILNSLIMNFSQVKNEDLWKFF